MIARKSLALLLALVMALSTFGLAAADEHIAACEGDEVIGSITSIDEETGLIVIVTETGECYVTLDQEYDHPIVQLFNDYFGATDSDNLTDAVAALDGWSTYDETTLTWDWSDEEAEGASTSSVTGLVDNGDGTYTLELAVDGEEDPVYILLTDSDEIAYYMALLDATSVEFFLTQDEEGISSSPMLAMM